MENSFPEVSRKILTLCLLQKDGQVLLGMKKRGFGEGRWNGFGGKLQQGESIEEATLRELREESGLIAKSLEKIGRIDFEFHDNRGHILEVHLYKSDDFEGEMAESDEMLPQWFSEMEVPLDKMWPDDKHWFPLFLAGKKFTGYFLFGENDSILKMELIEVENI